MEKIEKNIVKIVSGITNVPEDMIIRNKRATRHANVVVARQILSNILWRNFNYTNHMIRDVIGYKNHASVVHLRNTHEFDYKYNKAYKRFYDQSMDELGLYINDKDSDAKKNLDMKNKLEEKTKDIERYRNLWMHEKSERERIQGMLTTFKKKYMLK